MIRAPASRKLVKIACFFSILEARQDPAGKSSHLIQIYFVLTEFVGTAGLAVNVLGKLGQHCQLIVQYELRVLHVAAAISSVSFGQNRWVRALIHCTQAFMACP
mmetsp:Transcript_6374/g.13996  ORF Transcript_6374/g.13996 Transcript_6374/m.13996 type:complete len:104 (-) Transcript_6374:39-350(-)